MFSFHGTSVERSRFEPFEPVEILYDFDGPRTFTFRNGDGEIFLAHWCDEADDRLRYAVVPFTSALTSRLKEGDLSVRDSMDQPRQWIIEVGHDWDLLEAWSADFNELPAGALPERDVMLYPHLPPLISLRAIGERNGNPSTADPDGTPAHPR